MLFEKWRTLKNRKIQVDGIEQRTVESRGYSISIKLFWMKKKPWNLWWEVLLHLNQKEMFGLGNSDASLPMVSSFSGTTNSGSEQHNPTNLFSEYQIQYSVHNLYSI